MENKFANRLKILSLILMCVGIIVGIIDLILMGLPTTNLILLLIYFLGVFCLRGIAEIIEVLDKGKEKVCEEKKPRESILLNPGVYTVGIELLKGVYEVAGNGNIIIDSIHEEKNTFSRRTLLPKPIEISLVNGQIITLETVARFTKIS